MTDPCATDLFDSDENLSILISDAISGTQARLGDSTPEQRQTFLWSLLDYLMLLYQSPCYITLAAGLRRSIAIEPLPGAAISTLPSQDRMWFGLPDLATEVEAMGREASSNPSSTERLLVVKVADRQFLLCIVRALPPQQESMQCTEEAVVCNVHHMERILSPVDRAATIFQALEDHASNESYFDTEKSVDQEIPDETQYERYLEPLRNSIGQVFEDVSQWPGITTIEGLNCPTNLFSVIRRPLLVPREVPINSLNGSAIESSMCRFGYSASLFLPQPQFDWIENASESTSGNNQLLEEQKRTGLSLRSLLETPLGLTSRAITDTAFCSGNIVFSMPEERSLGHISRDQANTQADQDRSAVETWLYNLPFGSEPQKALFFIPIHVAGTPWLTLFLISPFADIRDAKSELMLRHYHFYRDAIPGLANAVAQAAQTAYVDALVDVAYTIINEPETEVSIIDQINREWRKIASIYPFQCFTLERNEGHVQIRLPDGTEASATAELKSSIRPQIQYRIIPDEVLISQIDKESKKYALGHIEATNRFVMEYGHRLKNALRETDWQNQIQNLINHAINEPLSEEFRQSLICSFSRLWMPQGLGSAMRTYATMKLYGNIQEIRSRWLTPDPDSFVISNEILETYSNSVIHLLQSIITTYRSLFPNKVLISSSPPTSSASFVDVSESVYLSPSALKFPPLRGDRETNYEAPLVLAAVIGEAAKNAIEYLAKNDHMTTEQRVLYWTVVGDAEQASVHLTLWNEVHDIDGGKPSSGIKIATHLAGDLNLATIEASEKPEQIEVSNTRRLFRKVLIKIHPQELTRH